MLVEQVAGLGAGAPEDRLRAWRRAHPLASLDEVLDAVEGELGQWRRRYLSVVLDDEADAGAAGAAVPVAGVRCGGRLERHGRRARAVLLPHEAEPLRLEREYLVCSSCGASLFPPRRGAGPGPR